MLTEFVVLASSAATGIFYSNSCQIRNFVVPLHPKNHPYLGFVRLRKHQHHGFVHRQECLLQWNYDRQSVFSSFFFQLEKKLSNISLFPFVSVITVKVFLPSFRVYLTVFPSSFTLRVPVLIISGIQNTSSAVITPLVVS